MSRVAWSITSAQLCRSWWGDTERPSKDKQVFLAARTCLSRTYSNPDLLIAPPSAFTNNSGTDTVPRTTIHARMSVAVSFQSGRHRSLRPLPRTRIHGVRSEEHTSELQSLRHL